MSTTAPTPQLHLRPQHRGVHLVTEEILAGLPELAQFQVPFLQEGSRAEGRKHYKGQMSGGGGEKQMERRRPSK
jgi:hypothetical protein